MGTTRPRLRYRNKSENMQLIHSLVHINFDIGPHDEDDTSHMNKKDTSKYISEVYKDCTFPLDVRMFKYHQDSYTSGYERLSRMRVLSIL